MDSCPNYSGKPKVMYRRTQPDCGRAEILPASTALSCVYPGRSMLPGAVDPTVQSRRQDTIGC